MNRKIVWLLSFSLLAVLAGLVFFNRSSFRYRNFEKIQARKGQIIEAVYGLGKVKSNQRFEVKLGVISTVRHLFVREGEFVQKGQRLVDFDTNASFSAPFAGTVTLVSVYEGETALPQTVVLRVENLKDRSIELSLEQEGALRVQKGQPARVSFESLRGEVLKGQVRSIYSRADEFLAQIEVAALDERILPGMTGDVSIEIGQVSGTLIPVKAIRNGMVLLERDGKVRKEKIEVGLIDGLSAEIKSGSLEDGDWVLVPKN